MAKHRTAKFARLVGSPEKWLRRLADERRIPCERDSNNARIFDDEYLELARQIYAERTARRGRPPSARAVAEA